MRPGRETNSLARYRAVPCRLRYNRDMSVLTFLSSNTLPPRERVVNGDEKRHRHKHKHKHKKHKHKSSGGDRSLEDALKDSKRHKHKHHRHKQKQASGDQDNGEDEDFEVEESKRPRVDDDEGNLEELEKKMAELRQELAKEEEAEEQSVPDLDDSKEESESNDLQQSDDVNRDMTKWKPVLKAVSPHDEGKKPSVPHSNIPEVISEPEPEAGETLKTTEVKDRRDESKKRSRSPPRDHDVSKRRSHSKSPRSSSRRDKVRGRDKERRSVSPSPQRRRSRSRDRSRYYDRDYGRSRSDYRWRMESARRRDWERDRYGRRHRSRSPRQRDYRRWSRSPRKKEEKETVLIE